MRHFEAPSLSLSPTSIPAHEAAHGHIIIRKKALEVELHFKVQFSFMNFPPVDDEGLA